MPDTRRRSKQPRATCSKCGRNVAHSFSTYEPMGYALFRHNGADGKKCPQHWVYPHEVEQVIPSPDPIHRADSVDASQA